jgi:hypothetical protein
MPWDALFKYINDIFLLLGWVATQISQLFSIFLMPFNFFFTFLRSFISNATLTPSASASVIPAGIADVFNSIPMWSSLTGIATVCLYALVAFYIINALRHL